MKRAWYLGHAADAVGDRAILIGDPGRLTRIAEHFEEVKFLPVSRGLQTLTGKFAGREITVASFGMGAPIATIVLHELVDLGITRFLRIGTAMYFSPAAPGDLLISKEAIGFDGTCSAYVDGGGPYAANPGLVETLWAAGADQDRRIMSGRYATYDAFYRDMFGIDDEGRRRVEINRSLLTERSVLAVDMETSALLAAANALSVSCATICLGTVDAMTQEKLAPERMEKGERALFETALRGLAEFE
ncbi:MAG: hypothetical protein OXI87_09800 [Albidovulum sp.]|nr:hypothetical protein [Albidovulum sp.]MDE0305161.1 hypothetical protein [Albidovulum sp.]MDE0530250.1 hypothetical protein [Albidovulum sp.]